MQGYRARIGLARALLLALGCAALPAFADRGDDIARLREEAADLRQRLDQLDAKIQALGGANPAAAPPVSPSPVAPSAASLQQSWSQVRSGVPKERVHALLGEPARVMHLNGDLVWYYVYPGVGAASVFFNTQDKVTAVQAPSRGPW